ncbi:L-histidine N(alpha)-methyltransferase [Terriglobus sp.]|uniref:L-histidine N(alpha)-methyltransferase n=1 Tax=Terriglobus sp. TaxID=1889013 RepID=UPI003AFFCFD0
MSTYSAPLQPSRTTATARNIDPAVAAAVRSGLTASHKSLPAWLFYDAEGSRLFERITLLPEYYLTRTERAIFTAEADRIIAAAFTAWHQATGDGHITSDGAGKLRLLELGAGTATKTGILLAAAVRAQGETSYLPIDVSASAIAEACDSLAQTLPQVNIQPEIANYVTDVLGIPPHNGPTLALYIGSSVGNFAHAEAVAILRNLRAQLQAGDTLLLGTDLVKDTAALEAAYCDADGVTEAFNLNMLRRLHRELGASFDLSTFRHVASFNREASRIEMHLKSTRNQYVRIPALNLSVPFQVGETIHTENSYKFTRESIAGLLREGGFSVTQTFTDPQNYFAVTLSTVAASS